MIYQGELTIPPNTSRYSPARTEMIVLPGTITRVEVAFPPGCVGLAHLVVKVSESQLFPSSPDKDFAWDAYTIGWDEQLVISERPFTLTLVGWNEDELYPHTITVRVAMLSGKITLEEYMSRLFGLRQAV